MIFVEMSDKIKILLTEQEDKGQPYFAAAKMMRGWFNVVDSSFWHKETGTKNLNNCPGIRQPNAGRLI